MLPLASCFESLFRRSHTLPVAAWNLTTELTCHDVALRRVSYEIEWIAGYQRDCRSVGRAQDLYVVCFRNFGSINNEQLSVLSHRQFDAVSSSIPLSRERNRRCAPRSRCFRLLLAVTCQ
jgi:hypothetical protein